MSAVVRWKEASGSHLEQTGRTVGPGALCLALAGSRPRPGQGRQGPLCSHCAFTQLCRCGCSAASLLPPRSWGECLPKGTSLTPSARLVF